MQSKRPPKVDQVFVSQSRTALRNRLAAALRAGSIFVALFVICSGMSFASPIFLTTANILNILLQAATVSIVAAGLTVVILAGEIDLSIGSLIGLTGSVAAVSIIVSHLSPAVGIVVALMVGCAVGLFNGLVVVIFRVPSFVITLAMLGMAQGAGLLTTGGRPISGFPEVYSTIGQGRIGLIPVPTIIAFFVYLFIHLLLTKTKFGVELYATGGARYAAALSGIRVNRIIVLTFVLSGMCAAISGIILSSRLNAGNGDFGAGNLLDAVAAVVVGGTSLLGGVGTVIGTLGGVLIISVVRNGLILLNIQAFWQQVAVGAIIVLAVVINQVARGELSIATIWRTLKR